HPDPLSVSWLPGRTTVCSPPSPELPHRPDPEHTVTGRQPPVFVTARCRQPNRRVVSRTGPIIGVDMGPIVSRGPYGVASGRGPGDRVPGRRLARPPARGRAAGGDPVRPAAAGIGAAAQPGSGRSAERVPRGGGGQLCPAGH